MKLKHFKYAAAAAVLLGAGPALAAGTDAGTDVNNRATVNYTVGTVAQELIESSPTGNATSGVGNGADTTFKTDRAVNLLVTESGSADVVVAPGSSNQAALFTVQNLTNDTIDILLTSAQQAGGVDAHGGTDNYDTGAVTFYVDDGDGIFEPGGDDGSPLTTLDDVAEDAIVSVWLVTSIPAGQADGSRADVALIAQAADAATSAPFTQDTDGDDPTTVENVFADAAGTNDGARDGYSSDDDVFAVSAATLTVTKSSRVITDPVYCTTAGNVGSCSATTNLHPLPGAVVEYCVEVVNTGAAAATDVVITDNIAAQPVTYFAGSLVTNSTACTASDGASRTDASGDEAADPTSADFTGSTATGQFDSVAGGATARFQFRVTIN